MSIPKSREFTLLQNLAGLDTVQLQDILSWWIWFKNLNTQ